MKIDAISREEYLEYRVQNEQLEILKAYFNHANTSGFVLDTPNFATVMAEVLGEHPGLQEDIDKMYPAILTGFDKIFHIVFLTRTLGGERILLLAF